MKLKLSAKQADFYEAVLKEATSEEWVNMVIGEVYQAKSVKAMGEVIHKMFEHTRKDWKHPPNETLDCKKGCSLCCYLNVDVFKAEMILIRDWLKRNVQKESVQQYKAKGVSKYTILRGLTLDEKLGKRISCAFLSEQGTCDVYEVRPIACRQFNSYRYNMCEIGFKDPSNRGAKNAFWSAPMRVGKDISLGVTFALYLKFGNNLKQHAFSLEEGIFRML